MALSKERRVLFAGAALALAAGLGLAAIMIFGPHRQSGPPPAAQGGLMVQTGPNDDVKLDSKRPLRCFVNGQFVGELPLDQCASRNGVATGALDVGLDPNGALAASGGPSADITPLPPSDQDATPAPESATEAPSSPDARPQALAVPTTALAACWRYAAGRWTALAGPMSLSGCVQVLYQGQCERPGGAAYGRWGQSTLRLVSGEVQVSRDNRRFGALVMQGPACSLPAFG
jgi:hypothetical protein